MSRMYGPGWREGGGRARTAYSRRQRVAGGSFDALKLPPATRCRLLYAVRALPPPSLHPGPYIRLMPGPELPARRYSPEEIERILARTAERQAQRDRVAEAGGSLSLGELE